MAKWSTEQKASRFKRIAAPRTQRVIERLHVLSNCSNSQFYEWTPEQIDTIFRAIEKATSDARARFEPKQRTTFKLETL